MAIVIIIHSSLFYVLIIVNHISSHHHIMLLDHQKNWTKQKFDSLKMSYDIFLVPGKLRTPKFIVDNT